MSGKKEWLAGQLWRNGLVRRIRLPQWGANRSILVLAYHRIVPAEVLAHSVIDPELVSATPEQFRQQLGILSARFDPVDMSALIRALDGGAKLPARPVLVTFDDGHADNHDYAFPILRQLGVPATIFLSTAYIDSGEAYWFEQVAQWSALAPPCDIALPAFGLRVVLADRQSRAHVRLALLEVLKHLPDERRLALLGQLRQALGAHRASPYAGGPLSWRQVTDMADAGIDFGSHSVTHPVLTRLDPARLRAELIDSKRRIESMIGKPVQAMAYPEGGSDAFDRRVIDATREAGYSIAFSYIPGGNNLATFDRFAARRLQIEHQQSEALFRAMLDFPRLFSWHTGPHTRSDDTPLALRNAENVHGWRLLLGAEQFCRVLCIEPMPTSVARVLRASGAAVTAIHFSPSNAANAWNEIAQGLAELGPTTFDLALIHDPAGRLVVGCHLHGLESTIRTIAGHMADHAVFHINVANAANPNALRHGFRGSLLPRVRAILGRALCTSTMRVGSYLNWDQQIAEVIPAHGYVSTRNTTKWRERLKATIFGPTGRLLWSHAFGISASRGRFRDDLITLIRSDLGLPTTYRLDGLMCLWRKMVVSFGLPESEEGVIVVVTADALAAARRASEQGMLVELRARAPELAGKLPRVIAQAAIRDLKCFAMTRIPGMTIDRPAPGTADATHHAVDFLIALHRATRDNPAKTNLGKRIGCHADAATERYPRLVDPIRAVQSRLLAATDGWQVPVVWQHGDFKLENVMLDARRLTVNGVIDWELADPNGLPILDMLYLFAYNRSVNGGGRIADVYLDLLADGPRRPDEHREMKRYLDAMGLTITNWAAWAAMYFLHDAGVRFKWDLDATGRQAQLEHILSTTLAALDAPPRGWPA
jgi:peptidoglycan/xylan/chitin deacetylase (PgdA/CDA1 family)/aminoglycoside phosphotransferase (APT) family kinase protein